MKKRSGKGAALIKREVDAAARRSLARANALLDLIARRIERIKEDFYEVGLALKEIRDKKLFATLGHRTFDALLAKRHIIGRSQAYKLIAVVEHVTREQALEFGEEKAYALARLVEATPQADTIDAVVARGVDVGKKHEPVRNLSRRGIDDARKKILARGKHRDAADRAAHDAAKQARARLRAKGVRATIDARHEGGKWWAVLRLPIDDLPSLLRER